MNLDPFHEQIDTWRREAKLFRRRGAEDHAATLESAAADLEALIEEWMLEELTLQEAVEESGYVRSSFERWLANGEIPNAGEEGCPRVRRCDLPQKPGGGPEAQQETDEGLPDVAGEILSGAPV